MGRKPRSDSKLDRLPPEVRQELVDLFLHENVSLWMAKTWLGTLEEPVSISLSSLHGWYQRVVLPLKKEVRRQRAVTANALVSEAQGKEVDWSSAVEIEVAQQAYEMLTNGASRKMALDYAKTTLGAESEREKLRIAEEKLRQADRKIELDGRRLKLLEKKARERDEAGEQWRRLRERDAEMSEAEREETMRLIDEKLLGLR